MPDLNIYTSKLNTGKITFNNGIKIIGALGGSSDGEEQDTIELVPDIDTYSYHQYLVVEPIEDDTSIHIRAGGNVDDSGAILVLGGLLTSIGLSDQSSERIVLSAKNEAEDNHHEWTLNSSGATGFPIINADLHNESAPQLAEVLQFNSSQHQSVITNAVPPINVDAERIIIQGQRGTGTGEGGDVYLWGGDGDSGGGNIELLAGNNDDVGGGNGGYVNIQAGSGYDYGGDITVRGGTSPSNIGGSVAIYGGTGDSYGQVTITNDSYTWTFKNDGNTTIPNGKDILDVAGNSVTGGGNRYKSVNSAASPTITYDTENIILVTTTGAGAQSTTIRLPDKTSVPIGYDFTVMDLSGGAATKNITILPKVGNEIISIGGGDGIVINTNYGLVSFKNVSAGWAILYGR